MTYKSHPKRDSSPDSPEINRFRVQGPRIKGNCSSTPRNGRWVAVGISGPGTRGHEINEAGFTLMEIIAALIVISVLAAMIIPATWHISGTGTRRTGLQQTARGVGECRTLFELRGEMERIVGIYKKALQDSSGNIDLETFWETVQDDVYIVHIDTRGTGYIEEDGDAFSIDNPSVPTNLFLITLSQNDFRITSIFSKCP